MEKLNFYTVDLSYVDLLKSEEATKRGFTRVPNMDYGEERKPKFLCGIVLNVGNTDYYVPVTSYKQKKPDNFLIYSDNGQVVGSLRFNYMFPVPKELLKERRIDSESDKAYRSLLAQELQYCRKNQEDILHLAERTYKRVLLGKNPGLVANSCDFKLLEEVCTKYISEKNVSFNQTSEVCEKRQSILERLNKAKQEAAALNSAPKAKKPHNRDER